MLGLHSAEDPMTSDEAIDIVRSRNHVITTRNVHVAMEILVTEVLRLRAALCKLGFDDVAAGRTRK